MTAPHSTAAADTILSGGNIITMDPARPRATAMAIRDDLIVAIGSDKEVERTANAQTVHRSLAGKTVIPGLVDGHAHMDREGLKKRLPTLAGVRSIKALKERLRAIAATRPTGTWIVTMPLGDPPFYWTKPEMFEEGRWPTRHDLDEAVSAHPLFILPPWGYWPGRVPLHAFANGEALHSVGIDRTTKSPSALLEIVHDASGEPTGMFLEHGRMPLAEFTLFRDAPTFTSQDRLEALRESMRDYNRVGTTSIFEGHGVAPEVFEAYRAAYDGGMMSVRAHLVLSPSWGKASADDVKALAGSWLGWLRGRGLGDKWLAASGVYTEIGDDTERLLRAACAPNTGWAGFLYDATIPHDAVRALAIEAARNGIRVCGVWQNLLEVFREADRVAPIAGQRWILGHQHILDSEKIALIRDLGIGLTVHPNSHIYKRGSEILQLAGSGRENDVLPIRSLLAAGIPVALSTDNVPISLFGAIGHSVARIDRLGRPIAPEQAISVEQALHCATVQGAWLSFEENIKGSLAPGRLADLVILDDDPTSIAPTSITNIAPLATMVGGRFVFEREPRQPTDPAKP